MFHIQYHHNDSEKLSLLNDLQKDNLLLYAAVIFLWFKADKSVGIVLTGIWLILNIGLVIALLGQMSAYLLPAALLLVGVILYLVSTR